jgi:HEAT repeat protein
LGSGFDITVAILADSPNEAAVGVLVPALASSSREIQEGALRALVQRRSVAGHLELVRRWDSMSDRWRSMIVEQGGRISVAVREALLSKDHHVFSNGCQAAVAIREFDLMPVLVGVVEEADNPHAHLAAQTMVELAELLHDELAAPRDYRERRDPQLMRQHVVGSLESSLLRSDQPPHVEVVESFLLLTQSDNSTLRRILDDLHHSAHTSMRATLCSSPRPGVMRIILKYLEKTSSPTAVLQVLAHRRDVPFLRRLSKSLGTELSETVRRNLRRIDRFAWFDELPLLKALNETEQSMALQIAVASGALRDDVFAVVRFLLREGNAGGRRAAAAALREFRGFESNELAMIALDDTDPLVQAAIIPQLRERGIPGAMARIIALVDSSHEAVRTTAQRSLAEFNFQRYLAAFDILDDEVRRTTGALVRKVDEQTLPQLVDELDSPSRIRRVRGLQVAPLVSAVAELEEEIIAHLSDEDQFVRAEAARALGTINSAGAQQALQAAQHDRSAGVREVVEQSLLAMLNRPHSILPPLGPLELRETNSQGQMT